jgi:preprotein translocase subunit SecE
VAKAASSGPSKGGKGAGKGRGAGQRTPVPPPSGQRVGMRQFVRESWGELRKVQWPSKEQVAQGTLVVIVVAAFFAAYIFAVDQLAGRAIKELYQALT